jgi:hypothetical protein
VLRRSILAVPSATVVNSLAQPGEPLQLKPCLAKAFTSVRFLIGFPG